MSATNISTRPIVMKMWPMPAMPAMLLNEMHRDDVERPAVIARAREGINVSPVPPARDENNNDGTDPE